MNTFGARLKSARKNAGLSQETLANMSGVSQGLISKIERGDQDVTGVVTVLALHCCVDAHWLATGEGSSNLSEPELKEAMADYNVEPANLVAGEVPIISWVQAGNWEEVMDVYHPKDTEYETVQRISRGSKVYGLRVKGDSMTSPPGSPHSFPEGYIIQVDPMLTASEGDFVIAKVNGHNEATFKQLKSDGGRPYLRPLNPSHPTIFEEFRVIGRVVGVSLKL